ncbi:MAG TPA: lysylphosphatidylglycerol synthase transmembrane domain-containing protein [Solirubrobacterales bacterium]|nr:lysylphosphatidylglycerol synthase transmembrane domain-containing protein [Solirubrobacterales bacterium]
MTTNVRRNVAERQPFLHRVGAAAARIGSRPPRSKGVRLAIQMGIAVVVFGFLVLTVINQWSEIRDEGVHFHVIWLLPAFLFLGLFYTLSALGWDLILRSLGHQIGMGRAQVAWGQPLLARYVPGSVLYVLGRLLLSERAGVSRRITLASIVYEQAISATSAIIVAAYFIISHPDLEGEPIRWAVLVFIPVLIVVLSPRVFRPLTDRVLRAFGREPLPAVISLRGIVALLAFYTLNWGVVAIGLYCVARSVSEIPYEEILTVGSAQAVGYVAALVTLVAPAGLGIRDAAFAWAVKVAVPGQSFAVASLIAIVVRGVMTVVELGYVGAVTALGKREGWSIPTGVLHPSPEEQAAEEPPRTHQPEIL